MADDATQTQTSATASTEQQAAAQAATQQAEQKPAEQQAASTESKDSTDWTAEARKWEQRAKENKSAADELAKLKQAQMTDQEKAQAASKAATDRAEAAERRAALLQAAVDHGLTKDDLALLEDVPADKVADRAKALATRLKAAAPAGSSGAEVGGDKGARKPGDLNSALAAHYSK